VVSATQQLVSSTCKFKRVDLKNLKYTLLKKESDFYLHISNRRVSSAVLKLKLATIRNFLRSRKGVLRASNFVCCYLYKFLSFHTLSNKIIIKMSYIKCSFIKYNSITKDSLLSYCIGEL
jgi:hypothetical protein